jgi:TolA-binding protein
MKKIRIIAGWTACWLMATAAFGQAENPFQKHYDSGLELFRAEQFLPAQKEFEAARNFLNIETGFFTEEIDYYLAACAARNGSADAQQHLEAFVEKYPATLHGNDVRLTLGGSYQSQGKYAEALTQYAAVNPSRLSIAERSEFYFNKGYSFFQTGEQTAATREFTLVGNDRVYGPSATYYRAYIDYEAGDLAAARSGFLSLTDNRQYGPIVPFYLLHIDFKSRDYRAVVESGPTVLQSATGERKAEILRVIGESWYHLENYPEALRYLDVYAAENPELNREEEYMLGYAAYMTGDFKKAIAHLGRVAVGEDLLAQNASFHIGSASLRLDDKQKAKQAFSLAMRLDADKTVQEEAMFNFSKLEYELGGGLFNQSIETINRFLEQFPESVHLDEARSYLTAAYLNNKNYAAAYGAVAQIRNPNDEVRAALQKIAYFRGLELFMEGDYTGAQQMFASASANRYGAKIDALTKFWQAETYYRQGQFLRAVPLYQDYIVLAPKGEREHVLAHYNLAYCYFNLKNGKEARTWFDRFLALRPTADELIADTYNRLGDLDYLDRNYAAAIKQYDRVIALGTNEADYARFQRAIALGLSSGPAQKIAALQPIASGTGEYAAAALYELGSTYTRQENFAQASATLQEFIRKYPDSPFHLNALIDLGLISQNTGRADEAMRYYKQVVDGYPNSPQAKDAMLGIRNLYMDAGDPQGYFAYASEAGMETNVGQIERDSLTFHVAERIHLQGDARRSLPLMQTYLSQFPQGNYTANATYYMAENQMNLGDTDKALAGFERVIAMKFSPFTLGALQKAATLNFQQENYRDAADQYYRLSQLATVRGTVEQALLGHIRAVDKLGAAPETLKAADYVLHSPFVSEEVTLETQFALGGAYLNLENKDAALDAFRHAAANMKTRNGSEAQYQVIRLLFDAGKLDEAEQEVFRFSDTNTSHQYWLGKSFLVLGDIYRRRGDDFQAKATWQSIVNGYGDSSDGIVNEARKKLSEL